MAIEFNPIKFGARIRRLRLAKKLSIIKLAELSNVNKNTICNVENGERKTSIDTVYKIAAALDTDPVELMDSKAIEDVDYIVKRSSYESGKRKDRKKIANSPTYRIGDTQVHLDNGNLMAGIVEVFKEGRSQMSSHDGEELFFCLTGKIMVTINNAEVRLSKGDCVLFWGSEPHNYKSEQDGISVGLSVISGSKHKTITDLHKNIKGM